MKLADTLANAAHVHALAKLAGKLSRKLRGTLDGKKPIKVVICSTANVGQEMSTLLAKGTLSVAADGQSETKPGAQEMVEVVLHHLTKRTRTKLVDGLNLWFSGKGKTPLISDDIRDLAAEILARSARKKPKRGAVSFDFQLESTVAED